MNKQRSASLLGLTLAAALTVAACGSDSEGSSDTTAGSATEGTTGGTTAGTTGDSTPADTTADSAPAGTDAAGGGEGVSLAGDCPDTVAIQLDWMPEAEHGFIYQMVGEGYEIDAGKAYVTGPLIDADGNDTGVKIQVRSGGAAQNFSPVTQLLYESDDVLLGYVYTDEAIQFSGDFPTVAIQSGFEKNPQMLMWDPETYPDVTGIADLGTEGVKIRYFGGAAYMDFFTGTGVLSKDQVDGSYTGDPSLFIADEGAAAQQGFGSAEPYLYENELTDWGKPVKYEYINDAGWENYAESIATKPENIETYAACFEKLVPIIQQASVDYVNDPARTNEIILAAVDAFGEDFGWTYSAGAADFGVATMLEDGLIANGPDDIIGNFDLERVNKLIELAVPIYTAQGATPKEGVTADDIVTNEFIDESIGL
jgi:hypothetical protein